MTQFVATYLTKNELLAVLDDIRAGVEANDSFEGSLSYELPWSTELGDPVDDSRSGFRVRAAYRTGNTMGQGGMRMIGEWMEDQPPPDIQKPSTEAQHRHPAPKAP